MECTQQFLLLLSLNPFSLGHVFTLPPVVAMTSSVLNAFRFFWICLRQLTLADAISISVGKPPYLCCTILQREMFSSMAAFLVSSHSSLVTYATREIVLPCLVYKYQEYPK